MDINGVLNIILPIVFIAVGIALIFFVIELIKIVRTANSAIAGITKKVDPLLDNVNTITEDIQPAIKKIDPLMDRVQLTVDSVNLEMMRVDAILEDVSDITEAASSATAAVDNITNAPLQAVNNVASRFRNVIGGKSASAEAAQLAEQRVAVAQALENYKAAEENAQPSSKAEPDEKPEDAPAKPANSIDDGSPVPGAEPVIDPKVIAESPFFDDEPDAK